MSRKMRIVILGLSITSSWGNGHATPYRAIIRALHRMGHRVHFFERDVPYYRARRDFETCDYCELTFYADWGQVRNIARRCAALSRVRVREAVSCPPRCHRPTTSADPCQSSRVIRAPTKRPAGPLS